MAKKTMVFEIEVELEEGDKLLGIELKVMRQRHSSKGPWEHGLSAMFGKPQRVRHGKHLLISQYMTTVKEVGE